MATRKKLLATALIGCLTLTASAAVLVSAPAPQVGQTPGPGAYGLTSGGGMVVGLRPPVTVSPFRTGNPRSSPFSAKTP